MNDSIIVSNKEDLIVLMLKHGNYVLELIELMRKDIILLTDRDLVRRARARDLFNALLRAKGMNVRIQLPINHLGKFYIDVFDTDHNDLFRLADIKQLLEIE